MLNKMTVVVLEDWQIERLLELTNAKRNALERISHKHAVGDELHELNSIETALRAGEAGLAR